jgi:hypothetical protein
LAPKPTTTTETLVLKTEYNLAWNYFNAHEFGQTIFDYWAEWLRRHDAGTYSIEYPRPPVDDFGIPDAEGNDLRLTTIFNSRVIVSRKRTRNFMDLTNLWKKSVLEALERDVLADLTRDVQEGVSHAPRTFVGDIHTHVVGPRSIKRPRVAITYEDSDEEETTFVNRRSPSPRTNDTWRGGAMRTWGRGARP